jgi:hypothetical protein
VALFQEFDDTPVNGRPSLFFTDSVHQIETSLFRTDSVHQIETLCWAINKANKEIAI